jgi:phosphoglycolate phosphatase
MAFIFLFFLYNTRMRFSCVLFDLDGTLVDTIRDIAASMNRAMKKHGFPPLADEAYIPIVGRGIKNLARDSMPRDAIPRDSIPHDDAIVTSIAADAALFYAEKPLVYSRPYIGIPELLCELERLKVKRAVISNKPDPVAQLVVSGLFGPGAFHAVSGERPGTPRKPDPAACFELLVTLDKTPRQTIFVGDSEVDMETAQNLGCFPAAVSWGYRDRQTLSRAGAKAIIDKPFDLLNLIKDDLRGKNA